MKWRKTIYEVIDWMKSEESIAKNIVHWETVPPKEAQTVPFPAQIDERLMKSLTERGINSLYTHQAAAFEAAINKKHFVAVTPTASGKTLCYNLPVLQKIVQNNDARALYLFPTKALAQDQKSELNEIITQMGVPINSYTYDGDTAPTIRQKVRKAGHVVITNPDMLHSAILPHHTKWVSLFENLEYIVIDELHTYRGVFGSHVANVIRRLKRICNFYGSNPTFICTSATIANPKELAQELTGEDFELINNNGAPASKKHIVFYNPPIVNKPLNIRRSATLEVRKLAAEFLQEKIQTIVFAKSRVRVEILLTYLKELVKNQLGEKSIQGYRGGYLPTQRRAIEKGLRNGEIYGVISTNALELGVDIGQLQVCIMTGYPGTIASAWQQAGRAGRRQGEAVIVMVASSNPLDQYVIQHPEFFLKSNPESARINPNNLVILVDHIKCAAYELPFKKGDTFDGVELEDILDYLADERVLHENGGKFHWMNDAFPAHNISLRSASQENVIIIDQSSEPANKVIGEMDRFSSMTLLHDEAIYLHQGVQYQVEKLDWEEKKAFVREVNVDYFTDANLAVSLDVLEVDKQADYQAGTISFGDVSVRAMATIFKKIKFETHENIGSGPIYLPEEELQTSATWITLEEEITERLKGDDLEKSLLGIAHALKHVIPLLLMCEPMDMQVVPQVKSTHDEKPVVYFYDRYPGGVGLSEKAYDYINELLTSASELIGNCPCRSGCPSCIGADYPEEDSKELALSLLQKLV
ncbi:MAG: DEAD/DEAH box helicase [Bacillota bacterium]|jgi:DEAD/DEAH box helicase domain-containing protein|uniref:DEAD/DEAH box helicase n=1 Tax=Bacillus sp. RO2 TaxID=2723913 RepID=UPI00145D9F85|nr:DEAD/DEAH box helicase [Bacillus sp. RO2]MEA3319085.1 DEAD/DEAH box helicase [Bacillota bacterium]NMH74134.1 DEAD/DEAH box helicase [Bacillus sp. RO2]